MGVIGLGQMGGSVAKRFLENGYEVYAYDIDETKKKDLEKQGAFSAESIKAVVKEVKVVLTSLPRDEILKSVTLGEEGILNSEISELTVIEISTVLPETIEEIERQFRIKNIKLLDCPVSGGPVEAAKGNLSLIVAGELDVFNEHKSLLTVIGKDIHYLNEKVGKAKAVKLINNTMTLGNVLVAASSFSLGMSYGLDPQRLYDILCNTGGRSHHFIKRFPKVVNEDYSPLFPVALGEKDLDLTMKWSEKEGFDTEVTSFIRKFYKEAEEVGLGNEDIVAVIKSFQKSANPAF